MIPRLFRHTSSRRLFAVGALICLFTLFVVDVGLFTEMQGLLATRGFDVTLLMATVSFLVIAAILLYPILATHYRQNILHDEEVKNLNAKYHAGLQAFQQLRETSPVDTMEAWRAIVDDLSVHHPDFAYIHLTLLDALNTGGFRRLYEMKIKQGLQTFEQAKKDFIRNVINATAWESIEDMTYSFSSYEMPVSFCMLAVAFGMITVFLIPFLGINVLRFGDASINLVWAAGGFTGAYIYSLYPLFLRYTRRDLPPRAFLHYAIRVFLGTIAVAILGNLFLTQAVVQGEAQFALSAVLGSVPFLVLNRARDELYRRMGWSRQIGVGNQDIADVAGITRDYGVRLHEEGVMNIQNLAFIDVDMVSKRTMFNKHMLQDWKDEAILRLLTGDAVVPGSSVADTLPSPGDTVSSDTPSAPLVYDALVKVGISNVTTLLNLLTTNEDDALNPDHVLNLLGWKCTAEAQHFLVRTCIQGQEMLGQLAEPSITAFAFSARV
jgi:hypothetical protein